MPLWNMRGVAGLLLMAPLEPPVQPKRDLNVGAVRPDIQANVLEDAKRLPSFRRLCHTCGKRRTNMEDTYGRPSTAMIP